MVIDPLRGMPVAFASTVNVTVPGPVPAPPGGPVTTIHVVPLAGAAVHEQPAPAVTVKDPLPPPATIGVDDGEIVIVQPLSWFTVTIFPATVAVPVRGASLLGWMSRRTVPFPEPLTGGAIVIHG